MKNWKRLLALFLSGTMALSLCACGLGGSSESPSPDPSVEVSDAADPDASPSIEVDLTQGPLEFSAGVSPEDVMLTVNGTEVHADLFLYMLAMNCMNMQAYLPYFNMTLADVADDLMDESITMAVYHTLIRQKAAELGCLPTDAQAEELRQVKEDANLEANAPYWGLSEESAEFIFAMSTYYNNLLDAVTHDPSPEELEEYMVAKGLYRVKHILFKTVDDNRQPLPEDQIAAKKAQAEDTLAQLQAASDLPALFDQLMNELSEDGRDESSGTLYAPDGYLAAPGDMVAEFEEASQALKEGELSGLVETEYGYHIILCLPLRPFTDDETADYEPNFRPDTLEDTISQWEEESDITRADVLSTLDVASFYDRLAAYQQALSDQLAPAESAPIESGGVG